MICGARACKHTYISRILQSVFCGILCTQYPTISLFSCDFLRSSVLLHTFLCKRTDDRRKSQENKLIVGYCVHKIPQKTDCNIRLIYVCLQARAPQITLHRFPASCLNVSLFAHVHYLSHLHSCAVCIFSLFIGNHLYIYI